MSTKRPKLWTSASIRKLARDRLAQDDKQSDEQDQPREINNDEVGFSLEGKSAPVGAKSRIERNYELEWIWGRFERTFGNRVILAVPIEDADEGQEMRLLCATLGLEVVKTVAYSLRGKPAPATYVGRGFLARLQEDLKAHEAAAVVLDAPLTPGQIRGVEEELKGAIVDRQAVILAIFQLHAKSKLAKMQVELARLKYMQPRLAGLWLGLSRQGGGGKGGLASRGLGETRLELDRRVVKDRIALLSKKLKESEKAYKVQSSRRNELPRVALVGYTNAGKSTLMRALTRTNAEVANKLFSTLDTTVRQLMPPTSPHILVSDTVGFVRDLPHDLVASFRSTLREALDSRLILHVVDLSHPQWRSQLETTDAVLDEIGAAELPKILILNKIDAIKLPLRLSQSEVARFTGQREGYIDRLYVSAETGEGVKALRERLVGYFGAEEPEWSRQRPLVDMDAYVESNEPELDEVEDDV